MLHKFLIYLIVIALMLDQSDPFQRRTLYQYDHYDLEDVYSPANGANERSKMIIFESILTIFKLSIILSGS